MGTLKDRVTAAAMSGVRAAGLGAEATEVLVAFGYGVLTRRSNSNVTPEAATMQT
jgi:hypothetical protein